MNAIQRKRLRAPVLTAACGLILAVAVLLAAGWAAALPVAAITALAAGACYWLGGTETDFGALIAARVDEAVGCTPLGAGVRSRRAVRDGDDRGGRSFRTLLRPHVLGGDAEPSLIGRPRMTITSCTGAEEQLYCMESTLVTPVRQSVAELEAARGVNARSAS